MRRGPGLPGVITVTDVVVAARNSQDWAESAISPLASCRLTAIYVKVL